MPSTPRGKTFLAFAPEACRRLSSLFPENAGKTIDDAEAALGTVPWHNDVAIATWVATEPFHAIVALATLADEPRSIAGDRLAQVLPELQGLVEPPDVITYEHAPAESATRPTPLLDQVLRALRYALPRAEILSGPSKALLTIVLSFSDVAKGGSLAQREVWLQRLGVDGTVHNEDSAVILEDVFRRVLSKAPLSEDGRIAERARCLCAASGLVGMRLRGEVSRDALAPFLDLVRAETDGGEEIAKVWSVVNAAETAAVRPGLLTPEFAAAFVEEERAILGVTAGRALQRSSLAERIARIRHGALVHPDEPSEVEHALETLRGARRVLESRLARAQIWYAEAALGTLSLPATVRFLLHVTGAALRAGIDTSRTWHIDLLGLVTALRDADGTPRRYPTRLFEVILESTRVERLLQGHLGAEDVAPLVTVPSTKGGEHALRVSLAPTREAGALLTLLDVYETKAAPAFHATMKSLCDLYSLRKDDFDRVSNEAAYLSTMNTARSDKSRMLDFVVSGTIVEVGPGGGVVLDLLAERFPQSRVVGLDASLAVVEALRERTTASPPKYEVLHGDAFKLADVFGEGTVSTVVFCSVLHEIFSYVEWGEPAARFRFEAVEAVVAAAFRALEPGGRIVVRDGLMPKDEPRVLEFVNPAWREGFSLFTKTYEPRRIRFEELPKGRVRLSAPDLYEFLTTYTWGAASFPYEIREQRGVLPRATYVERLLSACAKAAPGVRVRERPVPADLASYLQPGYPANVLPHIRIFDETGEHEVAMPDVNGVFVIERNS